MKQLKAKLLATTYFVANEYLEEYVQLVTTKTTKKSVFRTQSHHILPKTYFKHFNMPIDNSRDNLAELLFKDHVKAHWLLQKCTTGFLRRNSGYALRYLIKGVLKRLPVSLTKSELAELQKIYEDSLVQINRDVFVEFYSCHSCPEVAAEFQISLSTVTRLATEFECLKLPKRHTASSRKLIDSVELYQYYVVENHTLAEAAEYFKVDKSTIIRRLYDCNIEQSKHRYRHSERKAYNKQPKDIEAFKQYYATHNRDETALYFNMSVSTVKRLIRELQISKKKQFNHTEILDFFEINGPVKTCERFSISRSHLYRLKNKFKPQL